MAGNDVYAAVDFTTLRGEVQLGVAILRSQWQAQAPGTLPPGTEELFNVPGMIGAIEATFNISNANPSALVIHANDAATGEKLEKLIVARLKASEEAQAAQIAGHDDPVEKALAAYTQRITGGWIKKLRPDRNGARLTFFRTEGNPSQQQLTTIAIGGIAIAAILPAIQAARDAARRNALNSRMDDPMSRSDMSPGNIPGGLGMDGARGMPPGTGDVNRMQIGNDPTTPPTLTDEQRQRSGSEGVNRDGTPTTPERPVADENERR